MARKDNIFKSFMQHPMLVDKYELNTDMIPETVSGGLDSEIPIIKTIALIVDNIESTPPVTDSSLRNLVNQYLNDVAI